MTTSPDPLARRQPGEGRRANQGLRDYAMMGAARSLRALLARYVEQVANGRQTPPTTSWRTISTWSVRHNWITRIAAYDANCYAEAEAARRKAVEEMAQRQATLGRDLQEKAAQALMLLRVATTEVIDENGQVIRVVKANLTARDIAALVKVGADLERLARGEATSRVDVFARVRELARQFGLSETEEAEAVAAAERIVKGGI